MQNYKKKFNTKAPEAKFFSESLFNEQICKFPFLI